MSGEGGVEAKDELEAEEDLESEEGSDVAPIPMRHHLGNMTKAGKIRHMTVVPLEARTAQSAAHLTANPRTTRLDPTTLMSKRK